MVDPLRDPAFFARVFLDDGNVKCSVSAERGC
jgi:hypothetical protein